MKTEMFAERQFCHLKRISDIHQQIKTLDPSLTALPPIAVIHGQTFYLFDIIPPEKTYQFIQAHRSSFSLPEQVLAAFPLDFYHEQAAAVVSAENLADPANDVFIFHEFVHCYQWNHFEQKIRPELTIAKQQLAANNMKWELNYPFPYQDSIFVCHTQELNDLPHPVGLASLTAYHQKMKAHLSKTDFEYMIWQEWKEGFARYVENRCRKKLGLKANTTPLTPPLDRVCFYEIGSRYIEMLLQQHQTLQEDLAALFRVMLM